MHQLPTSVSQTSPPKSKPKQTNLVRSAASYDDEFPALMESVIAGLGAELDTDLEDPSESRGFDKTACIKEALEACSRVAYAVSSLLSLPVLPGKPEPDSYVVMEQNALVGELKAECLLMQRLCTELAEDIGLRDPKLARELSELSIQAGALCHPYELLSLVRPQPPCHLDQVLTIRMSVLYELELFLTQLLTHHKNSKKSPWISLVIFVTHFFS